jgi:hypothetical protein
MATAPATSETISPAADQSGTTRWTARSTSGMPGKKAGNPASGSLPGSPP